MAFAKIRWVLLWLVAATGLLLLATLPISMQAQFVTGLVIVVLMALIKEFRAEGVWRPLALTLGFAVVMRYVYWRTTQTIPPISQLENFIPGVLLYCAEMYNVLMLMLSLFVVSQPVPPRTAPVPPVWPTVDIFIPTYNEDQDLLANTVAAARGLDYPKERFTVWLLDDGGTDQKCNHTDIVQAQAAKDRRRELQELCTELGARYLTRARNEHAKAGNLNNGLAQSTGDLVAVFDADHAPAREFLRQTVGYFAEDPKLFLVQTPHFFINPDPLERNLKTFEKMPSESEMFYGIIQRGLDKWNGSFFCGSAAVLRRTALATTNGFSGRSITEDCETALSLHRTGWHSVYVDKPLIAGLQPATFASFIGQRSRWAQGMMQILLFHFPPLRRGLTLAQRICYMSSMLFWFFPLSRMAFLFAPLCYLFFDLEIFSASGSDFAAYIMTYMLANLMMQNYLYGSFRWPWISELYEYIQSVHLLPAIVSVLLNPTKPTFKVTAKDESISTSRLSEIGGPFFVIFGILLAGVVVAIYRIIAEPHKADVTLVVGGWNLINLLLAGCALGVVSERGERQASRRIQVNRLCQFAIGDRVCDGSIVNVSIHGAGFQIARTDAPDLKTGDVGELRFTFHGGGETAALPVKVRRYDARGNVMVVGCTYDAIETNHRRAIADLVFANSKQWTEFQAGRRRNPGVLRGTLWFFALAVGQTVRGLSYILERPGSSPQPQAKAAERGAP